MTLLHKLLTTTLLCFAAVLHANAQTRTTFTLDGIIYETNDDDVSVTVTGLADDNKLNGIVIIPEEVSYRTHSYKVTQINNTDGSMKNASEIKEVTLPGTIKESASAFIDCTNLQKVKLNEGITQIGVAMFSGCTALHSISLPKSLQSINNYAFSGCEKLKTLSHLDSLISLGNNVFEGCKALSNIELPKSLHSIGTECFKGCINLKSVSIDQDNPYFSTDGKAIFNKKGTTLITAISLSNYIVPSTVETLAESCFAGNEALTSLTLHDGVRYIGRYSFQGCSNLTYIRLPEEMKTMEHGLFYGCAKLSSINIPSSITSIGEDAFTSCSSLQSITLPKSLSKISTKSGFSQCASLKSILIEEGNTHFTTDSTALYNITKDTLICFPGGITEYTIPQNVKCIRSYAFSNCDNLRNIQFEDGISDLCIEYRAFEWCESLYKVIIAKGIKYVQWSAFEGAHIHELVIPQIADKEYFENINLNYCGVDYLYTYPSVRDYIELSWSTTFINLECPYTPSNIVKGSRSISFDLQTNKYWKNELETPIDSLHPIVKINSYYVDDIIKANKEGRYIYRNLEPGNDYNITINTCNQAEQIVNTYKVIIRTSNYVSLRGIKRYNTRITLSIQLNIDPNIEVPEKCGIECDGKFYETEYNDKVQSVTIKDLWPGKEYEIRYREPSYQKTYSEYTTYPPINTYIDDITPTTYTLRGCLQDKDEDLNVVEEGFTFDGSTISEHSNAVLVTGCEPNSTIKTTAQYAVAVKKGNETRLYAKNFNYDQLKHPEITLQTIKKAKAISNTVALICAETNIDERETNVGFEWRRYDAPELVPSSEANCPIIDSTMTGALRNLSENTYYKFRPFYKSNSGKTWYGEWSAFGTADAYVYFDPTVRTFEVNCDNETKATVRAFVIAGSDEIKEQGFEYWKHSSTERTSTRYVAAAKEDNHQTIISTGQRMTATLENLEPNTTYSVRAYVTTEHGTTYGEEQIFSTPAPTAIGNVKLDDTQSGEMTVTINKANAQGVDFVVNGTRNEISAKLYSISGTVLSTTSTTDNGSDARNIKMQTQHLQSGMYLLCVTDGVCTKTIRLAIK